MMVPFLCAPNQGKSFPLPRPGLFWAAGFAFSSGEVVKEVPYETWHDLIRSHESRTYTPRIASEDIGLEDLFFGEACKGYPGVAGTAMLTLCSL